MIWSSKRMWRLLTPTRGLPAAALIIGVSVGTDSTSGKVPGGFVGILSLPTEVLRPAGEGSRKARAPEETPATLRGPGRVLYAPGREPRAVPAPAAASTPSSAEIKRSTRLPKPCPRQLVAAPTVRGATES